MAILEGSMPLSPHDNATNLPDHAQNGMEQAYTEPSNDWAYLHVMAIEYRLDMQGACANVRFLISTG